MFFAPTRVLPEHRKPPIITPHWGWVARREGKTTQVHAHPSHSRQTCARLSRIPRSGSWHLRVHTARSQLRSARTARPPPWPRDFGPAPHPAVRGSAHVLGGAGRTALSHFGAGVLFPHPREERFLTQPAHSIPRTLLSHRFQVSGILRPPKRPEKNTPS